MLLLLRFLRFCGGVPLRLFDCDGAGRDEIAKAKRPNPMAPPIRYLVVLLESGSSGNKLLAVVVF